MEYQRASGATVVSKKLSNGHSFNGKNMYDGVFGGQSKLGSRVEDYGEIFGGGAGSSIPVLDVPELNQRKFSVDVSTSKLDYSNIFAGFGDFDFAVSHEELIAKPTRDKKTPAKTRSHSKGSLSNPSSIPVGNQVLSNDQTSHASGIGVKQFNMSFNKSIPGSKNGRNGTTHVAQLHAVPGYTCLIDERITPSRDKSVPCVVNEPCETNNFDKGTIEGIHCKKPVSGVPSNGVSKETSKGVEELHIESRSNGSDSNDVLFGFYDVGRKTPPLKVRRASSMSCTGGNKHDSLKFGVSRSLSLDDDGGDSSPPYFDDEVDANSVAATSAAAVKKAIEEAQERLKVAKEMMERRKEGHIGRFKPSVNGSLKAKESKKGRDTVKQNNFRQDITQEKCEKIDGPVQTCGGVGKQNVMKVGQVAAESEDREKSFIAREDAGGTCAKNFISSRTDCRQEVKKSEAAKEGEREKDGMQTLYENEQEKKIAENPEKCGEKSEVVEAKVDASQNFRDKEECLHKLKPGVEFNDQKEDETKPRFSEQWEETEEKVCIELEACQRELKDQENPTEDEKKVEMQELKDVDNLERLKVDQEWVYMGEKHEHMLKQEENGYAFGDVFVKEKEMLSQDVSIQKEFEKIYEEPFEILEQKVEHQEASGPEENNDKEEEEEEACNREDNEQISDDKMEKPEIVDLKYNGFDYEEERERRLEVNGDSIENEEFMEAEEDGDLFKDAYQMEAVEEGQKEVPERVGTEEMQKQTDQKADEVTEENGDLFKDAYQMEAVEEGQKEVPERVGTEEMQIQTDQKADEVTEKNGDLFKDAYQMEAVEEGQKEVPERVGTEEMQKQTDQKADEATEENGDLFKDAYQMEAVEEGQKEVPERVGTEEMQKQADQKADETTEENGDLFEDAHQMEAVEGGKKEVPEKVGTEEMQQQTDEIVDETTEAREDALGCCLEDLEAANNAYDDNEINDKDETLEPSGNEDSCEMTPELLVNEENGEIAERSKAYSECKETGRDSEAVEVANYLEENLVFNKADLAESNLNLSEIEQQKENSKETFYFDKRSIDSDTVDTTFEGNQHEQHSEESETICTKEKHVEELGCESEEHVRQADLGLKQEENTYNFGIFDNGRLVYSQLHCKFGEECESTQIANEIETRRSTEYNEDSHHETLTKEEGETKSSQEEVIKNEQQRRIDEAKEKEREREKERIAVERAIREARGRAFAEVRERAAAGRTNVEARWRVKGEAQGESTKPSTEASDKTFMEAKLKAERAAVERATAEARQRALEKALSEKDSFGARKQAGKSSDAKQSFQSYDSTYKGACPPATSRYSNSTKQSASNSSEGLDGATGESAQRCKARLERHQRTAERAAKALAEKNQRDRLAQKEQAERNRLAETLDAEVKRWSGGKRGNLRALLSTLQYILGPDSGWQPIPLTDIIATAAVKKAYRKATLCVHPDKLQQRGASIQQKYTCEKVFDLLKEAWNKFSAEER